MVDVALPESPHSAGRKPKSTPHDILTFAWALFEKKGYDDTTMLEIAQAAGLSRRTLFNYYPTKESLLFPGFADFMSELRSALMLRPVDEPVLKSIGIALDGCRPRMEEFMTLYRPGQKVLEARQSDLALKYSRDFLAQELEHAVAEHLQGEPHAEIKAAFVGAITAQAWTEITKLKVQSAGIDESHDALAIVMTSLTELFGLPATPTLRGII